MTKFYEGFLTPFSLFRKTDYSKYVEKLDEQSTILLKKEDELIELMKS